MSLLLLPLLLLQVLLLLILLLLMLQVHVVIERPLLPDSLRAVLPHRLKGRSGDGILLFASLPSQLQDLRFSLQPDRDRLTVSAVGYPQDL